MFGLVVMEGMTLSGHLSNINEMDVTHKKSGSPSQKLPNNAPNYLNCDCFGSLKLELIGV